MSESRDAVEVAMELGHAIAWQPVSIDGEVLSAWVCTGFGGVLVPDEAGHATDALLGEPCPEPMCLDLWETRRGGLWICTLPRGHTEPHRHTTKPARGDSGQRVGGWVLRGEPEISRV